MFIICNEEAVQCTCFSTLCFARQDAVDGTEDELKDLSSGSEDENSDIPLDDVKKVKHSKFH